MATSAIAEAGFSVRPHYVLQMQVSRKAVSGNSSSYNWTVWVHRRGGDTAWMTDAYPFSGTIAGNAISGSGPLDFRNTNSVQLGGGSTPLVPHNSAGNMTLGFSAAMSVGGVFGSASASGTLVADRIPQVPGAPPAPVAKATTAAALTFTISRPADDGGAAILDYTMNVVPAGGGTATQWTSPSSNQTSPATLAPNTEYNVQYRARNAIGAGSWGPMTSMRTAVGVPAAPAAPTASDGLPTSVRVNWLPPTSDGGAPLAGYTVQRALNSAFTLGRQDFDAGLAMTYQFTDLAPSTDYYYRVVARNVAGDSPPSGLLQVTTSSGAYYSAGTAWRGGGVFVSEADTWAPAEIFVSDGSEWRAAI